MKALMRTRYGGPEVLTIADMPEPDVGPRDLLVRVHASAVNTGDWRLRAADFPGPLAVPARLMFGLFRPRNPRLGSEFAGEVVATGTAVTRFKTGDRVFGIVMTGGATAEYLAVSETAAIAPIPQGLDFADAAALPFGAGCALAFLRDFAGLTPGQRLLVVGASGGVGCYAVQIGKALGAHVTGIAGPDSQGFMQALGADQVIDYSQTDVAQLSGPYDVILDTIGVLTPQRARALLASGGRFYPLVFGWSALWAAVSNLWHDRKVVIASNTDTAARLETLCEMLRDGQIVPAVDSVFPLAQAAAAHTKVATRHRRGAIIVTIV